MAKGIDEIIADVQEYLNDLRLRIEQGSRAIALLRDLKFGPYDGSPRYPGDPGGPVPELPIIPTSPPKAVRPEDRLEPSRTEPSNVKKVERRTITSVSLDSDKLHQFKGVYVKKYQSGKVKYKVSFWDKIKRKHIHLGMYDNPYEAAAARMDYIGDHEEAKLLRAMAKENAENNPDRPLDGTAKHDLKRKDVKYIYVCKRCGLEYQSKGTCASCGYDDMRKVPME